MKKEDTSTQTDKAIRDFAVNLLKDTIDSLAKRKRFPKRQSLLLKELLKMLLTGEVNEPYAKKQGWQLGTINIPYKPIYYFTHIADVNARDVSASIGGFGTKPYGRFINLLELLI
jgi:hypothetical protein